ncbi:hypothetical protein SLEP1_g17894 [Rubroshorea leprosula]|uniref:Uncharacterized protein n=1 Tax=Rubroshorea leprosula TaxID=152421 RepID=A0AAV5IVT7_9ROSI|nr:hypothetical protein SLEP1_g17894 [Rubroshorea leprosula]
MKERKFSKVKSAIKFIWWGGRWGKAEGENAQPRLVSSTKPVGCQLT